MKTSLLTVFVIISIFVSLNCTYGQNEIDSSSLYKVETIDGNNYLGNVISDDGIKIEFNTGKFGIIKFPKNQLKSIIKIEKQTVVKGKLWLENPQSTRYFWSPNGYGLKKGEGYYQNIWVLWNQASVGLSNNFSIGVGLIPLFFFGGGEYTPVWIVPKFSVPVVKDKFNLGAGILAGTVGFQDDAGFGIAYGIGTYGNRNNNLTFGLGYGYAAGEWANRPLITISGMARLSSKTYFLSENFFIGFEDGWIGLLSFGARSIISKIGLDYGLFIPIASEMDGLYAFPWLGLTVPFGVKLKY
jgi:hypothetical protein